MLQHCEKVMNWQWERQEVNGINRTQQPTIMDWWKGEAKQKPRETPSDNEVSANMLLNTLIQYGCIRMNNKLIHVGNIISKPEQIKRTGNLLYIDKVRGGVSNKLSPLTLR
eukprot:c44126_g1_i1 orf=429-761(+)